MSAPAGYRLADGTPYGCCRNAKCRAPLGLGESDWCPACFDRLQAALAELAANGGAR